MIFLGDSWKNNPPNRGTLWEFWIVLQNQFSHNLYLLSSLSFWLPLQRMMLCSQIIISPILKSNVLNFPIMLLPSTFSNVLLFSWPLSRNMTDSQSKMLIGSHLLLRILLCDIVMRPWEFLPELKRRKFESNRIRYLALSLTFIKLTLLQEPFECGIDYVSRIDGYIQQR